ncbi:10192_t:CDS:2, partial [Acaulospora colombiana]
ALGDKKSRTTLAAALNELSNPAPNDVDPEEFGETFRTYDFDRSDGEEENKRLDDSLARDHYVQVDSLRQFILDDPKYVGRRSDRKAIFGDEVEISQSDDESVTTEEKDQTKSNEDEDMNEDSFSNATEDVFDDENKDEESEFDQEDDVSLKNTSSVVDELRKIEEDERYKNMHTYDVLHKNVF